jgi:hypothetical protein
MMTLISLAITVAFGTSLAATFGLFEIEVWWELASLITIIVLGHWLEMRAISQARGALNALAALLPDTTERVNGGEIQTVPLSELRVGDIVQQGMRHDVRQIEHQTYAKSSRMGDWLSDQRTDQDRSRYSFSFDRFSNFTTDSIIAANVGISPNIIWDIAL